MSGSQKFDAVVVGSGTNGLCAPIRLALAKGRVIAVESKITSGGSCASAELTLPGFPHDTCAAIHPLGIASPFLKTLNLGDVVLKWIFPGSPLANPLSGATGIALSRSLPDGGATARCSGECCNFSPFRGSIPLEPLNGSRVMISRIIIGVLVGGGLGFAFYKCVGCSTGACPLTSNPFTSTVYGAVIGALVAGS